MHVRAATAFAVAALAAGAGASVAQSCGGARPENLRAPSTLRATLRAVFLKSHPSVRSEDVIGPLPGRTYYGAEGDFHAVATFQVKGQPAYPRSFWRGSMKDAWHFSHDSHGGIRDTDIDPMLMALWGFTQWHGTRFYVEPR